MGFTNNQNILLLQAQARKAGWKRTINRILKKGNIDVSHAGAKGRITKKAIDETVRHLKGNIYRARELGEETKARQFERILGRIKKHLPQKK